MLGSVNGNVDRVDCRIKILRLSTDRQLRYSTVQRGNGLFCDAVGSAAMHGFSRRCPWFKLGTGKVPPVPLRKRSRRRALLDLRHSLELAHSHWLSNKLSGYDGGSGSRSRYSYFIRNTYMSWTAVKRVSKLGIQGQVPGSFIKLRVILSSSSSRGLNTIPRPATTTTTYFCHYDSPPAFFFLFAVELATFQPNLPDCRVFDSSCSVICISQNLTARLFDSRFPHLIYTLLVIEQAGLATLPYALFIHADKAQPLKMQILHFSVRCYEKKLAWSTR